MADALCREHPEVDFFPGRGNGLGDPAKAICRRCLVMRECRDYALADPDIYGIWGGTTERERARLRSLPEEP